jgi:hypothetical protein
MKIVRQVPVLKPGETWPKEWKSVPNRKLYKLQTRVPGGEWCDAHENDMNRELDAIEVGDDAAAFIKANHVGLEVRFIQVRIP